MSSFILVRTSLHAPAQEVAATDVFPRTSDAMLIMTAVISQVSLHLAINIGTFTLSFAETWSLKWLYDRDIISAFGWLKSIFDSLSPFPLPPE